MNRATLLAIFAAVVLSGCGEDPAAKKKNANANGEKVDKPIETREGGIDPALVATYREFLDTRLRGNEAGYRALFAGAIDAGSLEAYTETVDMKPKRVQHQFQSQTIRGDEATLVVKERIDEVSSEGVQHVQEVDMVLALVKNGTGWKIIKVKVDWK